MRDKLKLIEISTYHLRKALHHEIPTTHKTE